MTERIQSTIEFQSLIGMLKTWPGNVLPVNRDEFQSLIGMLKTYDPATRTWTVPEFQSLIGMLKTTTGIYRKFTVGYVSIPHRYAENIGYLR